jgi:WD40 repeat protein
MATGHEDRTMSIWDIRTQKVFASIPNDNIQGTILDKICFSEKGYQFAAAWKGSNVVKMYDMRKSFAEVEIVFPTDTEQDSISNIQFDKYGNYLMIS